MREQVSIFIRLPPSLRSYAETSRRDKGVDLNQLKPIKTKKIFRGWGRLERWDTVRGADEWNRVHTSGCEWMRPESRAKAEGIVGAESKAEGHACKSRRAK